MRKSAPRMPQPTSPIAVEAVDGKPRIVGRSSSHFTRVVRMCAAEARVPYEFQIVPSLASEDAVSYGGNPGLRMPNMVTEQGVVFGTLGCCRTLISLSEEPVKMIWPEATPAGLAANALELTLQAMSTEVTLVMLTAIDSHSSTYASKLRTALNGIMVWLDTHVTAALAALPERRLSYLELTLFCLIEHLEFRQVLPLQAFDHLLGFRHDFGQRPSARSTSYCFDV